MPLKMWFLMYGIASVFSLTFYIFMAREICKGYLTKKTRNLEHFVDAALLITCIIAHVLTHLKASDCEVVAPEQFKLLQYAIALLYIRLIKIILLLTVVVLCCPILLLSFFLRPQR
mmetsp:Transcript_35307/g.34313  ORF Transcript_35307/g.34313 Transcript_35307/m.34313 type:complete len:116 (+) Transcript_35307:199-546(+)